MTLQAPLLETSLAARGHTVKSFESKQCDSAKTYVFAESVNVIY